MLNNDAIPAPSTEGKAAPGAKPASKLAGKKRAMLAGAAVVLFGVGIAVGTALPDPTASEEYAALAAEKSTVEGERDAALSKYASLESKYDTLENGMASRESEVAAREAEVDKADAAVKSAEAAVKKREAAVTAAEKTKAANTISDGTWTVGRDIAPGTYRATADVGSSCYWGIYRSGSNGSDIIDNDLPGGGRPSVALSAGQDFKSSRCGNWQKQ